MAIFCCWITWMFRQGFSVQSYLQCLSFSILIWTRLSRCSSDINAQRQLFMIFTLLCACSHEATVAAGVDPDSFVMGSECRRHEISRGSGGMPPGKFWNLDPLKCHFLGFEGNFESIMTLPKTIQKTDKTSHFRFLRHACQGQLIPVLNNEQLSHRINSSTVRQ